MLRRIGLRRTLLLAALVLGSAACDDESPTLSGDPFFPGGAPPATREVIVPAGSAFRPLGVFTNYTDVNSVVYSVLANRYAGELSANALFRTAGAFPRELRYTQDNVNRTDTLFRVVSGTLVVRVDSVSSTAGPVTVQVFRAAQNWDGLTATWELASDTGGVRVPWRTPGGTKGELLTQGVYTAQAAGDSIFLPLDSADVIALRDTTGFGIILSVGEVGSRVQLTGPPLIRAAVRPSNAVRDTLVSTDVPLSGVPTTFVYTPEPNVPAGTLAVGGIRSSRTLFSLVFPDSVEGCAAGGQPCGRVALREVNLNRVSLLLRRAPISPAFAPLDSTALSVFSITEPELGRRAPLRQLELDPNPNVFGLVGSRPSPLPVASFAPGDTVVELDFTNFATRAVSGDTVPTTFALLGGPSLGLTPLGTFETFGLATFTAEPRLRIVYTLRVRSELP